MHASYAEAQTLSSAGIRVYVDRKDRKLWVIGKGKEVIFSSPVGVGSGGLKPKTSMEDLITPTGQFKVDLILFKAKEFNQVAAADVARYKGTKYEPLLLTKDSLAELFSNMNSLDFDRDGKADQAYGDGYIGLTGTAKEVCGPKMNCFGKTPYWYSIALHGTNSARNIGAANSGGCIHLPAEALSKLITGKLIGIGTLVEIGDEPLQ